MSREPFRSYLKRSAYAIDVEGIVGDDALSLVECRDCSARFQRSILTPAWMAKLYGEWIDEKQVQQAENERDLFEDTRQAVKHILRMHAFLGRASMPGPYRLLDYGCGGGGFMRLARSFGFDAYGVDPSGTRARMSANAGVPIMAEIERLDAMLPAGVHAASVFQVLEHVADPGAVLRAIASRMVLGGVLVVEVPDCRGISGLPANVQQFMLVHPLEHINVFTPSMLQALCEREGFERIVKVPAHVTTQWRDLIRTELSRFVRVPSTQQYFRRTERMTRAVEQRTERVA